MFQESNQKFLYHQNVCVHLLQILLLTILYKVLKLVRILYTVINGIGTYIKKWRLPRLIIIVNRSPAVQSLQNNVIERPIRTCMTWIGYTSLNTDMKRGNGATGVYFNPADERDIIKLCFMMCRFSTGF